MTSQNTIDRMKSILTSKGPNKKCSFYRDLKTRVELNSGNNQISV